MEMIGVMRLHFTGSKRLEMDVCPYPFDPFWCRENMMTYDDSNFSVFCLDSIHFYIHFYIVLPWKQSLNNGKAPHPSYEFHFVHEKMSAVRHIGSEARRIVMDDVSMINHH